MVSGLSFQVFTLVIFMALALDFALSIRRRVKTMGKMEALDQNYAALRKSVKFKGFLWALTFATLCIFTRCVYRVAELSEGWNGQLLYVEWLFIFLEGAIILAGIASLNIFHPGLCFREAD
jgi:RTA1 like protein